jgi:hypothetical protein
MNQNMIMGPEGIQRRLCWEGPTEIDWLVSHRQWVVSSEPVVRRRPAGNDVNTEAEAISGILCQATPSMCHSGWLHKNDGAESFMN